ncbi:MAG: OmpH family outer membrane protein [Pseudomonadota bacterium]|nr:OmpH family outer membrane protein [Pseudomonadota bacterium]
MKNEKECACGCSCRKKILMLGGTALVSALLAFGACQWCCCGTKTMVIDFKRVQREATVYKSIIDNQRGYEEKIQAQLGLEAGQLQQEEKDLVAQKGKLSETDFKKKALALQKKAMQMDQKYRGQVQQVLAASQMAASKVQAEVEEVLEEVSRKAGAGVVLHKDMTVRSGQKNDLTDRFVKALNEKVKPVEYPNPETALTQLKGQK